MKRSHFSTKLTALMTRKPMELEQFSSWHQWELWSPLLSNSAVHQWIQIPLQSRFSPHLLMLRQTGFGSLVKPMFAPMTPVFIYLFIIGMLNPSPLLTKEESKWLNRLCTHARMEPFIIAAHRHLSAMHPIYKFLDPRMQYTLKINALAHESLINAGGIIETEFTPGKICMQISCAANTDWWWFDLEGLPADLIRRFRTKCLF